jgi:hypothetical protein
MSFSVYLHRRAVNSGTYVSTEEWHDACKKKAYEARIQVWNFLFCQGRRGHHNRRWMRYKKPLESYGAMEPMEVNLRGIETPVLDLVRDA